MTGERHRGSDKAENKKHEDKEEKGGGLFNRVMGGLKEGKDAVVETGSKAIHKGGELVKEHAPTVIEKAKAGGAVVEKAVKGAARSEVGREVVGAGQEIVDEQVSQGKRIGKNVQKGNYKEAAQDVIPMVVMGPQGVIAEKLTGKALEKVGQKAGSHLTPEQQDLGHKVLEAKKIAGGLPKGFPSATDVIVGAAADPKTQNAVVDGAKKYGGKAINFFKGLGSSDDNEEPKVQEHHKPAPTKMKK
jgi:hypothetical protein